MLFSIYKGKKSNHDLLLWSIVLLAFTPNFFVTDTEHFVLTLPLLLTLLNYLIKTKKIIYWIIFVLLLGPFSLNSNDILGSNISDFIDKNGFMGISNIGFIVLFLLFYAKQKTRIEAVKN